MRLHCAALLYSDMAQCLVADDPQADKLLLVMEYAEAGPVMRGDRSTEKVPLAEGVALKFFRDVLQVKAPTPVWHRGFALNVHKRSL